MDTKSLSATQGRDATLLGIGNYISRNSDWRK